MWVVQEVSLASSIRVLYGRTEIQWECLAAALSRAITYPAIGSLLLSFKNPNTRHFEPTAVVNIQRMIHFQNRVAESKNGSISFVSTLFECDTFKSGDPRDKIFGIQGFCKDKTDPKTIPNYRKSTVKVYLATAKHLLKQQEDPLRLLSYAGIGYFTKPNPKFLNEKYQKPVTERLPSWCPDWSRRPRLGILSYRDSSVFLSAYRAGGGGDPKHKIEDSSRSRTLILTGREVDTISSLGPQLGIQRKEKDTEQEAENEATETWVVSKLKNQGKAVRKSWKLVLDSVGSDCVKKPYTYTNPNQKLRGVFWRTLSGDRTQTRRLAPVRCRAEFEQWISFQNYVEDTDVYSAITRDPETPLPLELLGSYGSAKFGLLFTNCGFGLSLCITKRGYIGAVPPLAREGDITYLIQGAQVPFVLRPVSTTDLGSKGSSSNSFELVGEAYLHGIMDEEFHGRDEVPSWRDVNLL